MPSPATWLPRGEGGVEGDGVEEAGQREKETFPPLSPSSLLSGSLFSPPLLSSSILLSRFDTQTSNPGFGARRS